MEDNTQEEFVVYLNKSKFRYIRWIPPRYITSDGSAESIGYSLTQNGGEA